MIQSIDVTYDVVELYNQIFESFDPVAVERQFLEWVRLDPPLFPSDQKNRDWSLHKKASILKNMIGLSHDPTKILLSGGFLKQLQHILPKRFTTIRDYVFNNILKRARGYRTNSRNRDVEESQIGITSFDLDALDYEKTWYPIKPWKHPGRSICGTLPLQGMYEHSSLKHFVPLKCGISGSTNFWIWTALFSGVNFTLKQTRLFILSAFIVLGVDGGHSLNEVLCSCTLSAIYWKHYSRFAKDDYLSKFIQGSTFARNVYEITKDINPIGNQPTICINWDRIARQIYDNDCCSPSGKDGYNRGRQYSSPRRSSPSRNQTTSAYDPNCPMSFNCHYPSFNDKKIPEDSTLARQQIEAWFLMENKRYKKPFAHYEVFLNQFGREINEINDLAINTLVRYIRQYC